MDNFGERLKQARMRAKMSQESLADKVSVTKGAVSQWENGIAKPSSIETVFGMADALLVDPRWLVTGKGDPELTLEMPHHIQLAKAIDRAPKDVREPLVKLIQAISSASEERFWRWAREAG